MTFESDPVIIIQSLHDLERAYADQDPITVDPTAAIHLGREDDDLGELFVLRDPAGQQQAE